MIDEKTMRRLRRARVSDDTPSRYLPPSNVRPAYVEQPRPGTIDFLWTVAAILSTVLLVTFAAIGIIQARGVDWGLIIIAVPAIILSFYFAKELVK